MNNIHLVHSECGSELLIQASIPTMIMTTTLTLIGNVINIIPVEIIGASLKLKINTDTLYCQHCRRKVKMNEIQSCCSVCRRTDSIENLFIAVPKINEQTATNIIHNGECHNNLKELYSRHFNKDIQIDLQEIKISLGGEQ